MRSRSAISPSAAKLAVIGEAPAGAPFGGTVGEGQAVRIFTGAPVPAGRRHYPHPGECTPHRRGNGRGRRDRRRRPPHPPRRPRFRRRRNAARAACACSMRRRCRLAASANHATLPVIRRPLVAIIATGDELLPPGSTPGVGQIIASNAYGVAAIARAAGADAIDLGIVRDRKDEMSAASATRWTRRPTSSSRWAALRSATTIWSMPC